MTEGERCILANDGRDYTVTAHCTTDTHIDFMLTLPKRATQQAALVVIRGTLDECNSGTSDEQPVHHELSLPNNSPTRALTCSKCAAKSCQKHAEGATAADPAFFRDEFTILQD